MSESFQDLVDLSGERFGPPVVAAYNFSGIETLVDVGGGHGLLMASILNANPTMRGIVFDLPLVVTGTPAVLTGAGVTGRCEVVGGDFFENVPAADAYVMKHIIHDWEDDKAIAILRNCRKALSGKPGGKVILVEFVVPPGNEPHASKVIDIEMLMYPGGHERTAQEFRELFAKAGFRMTKIVPTKSPFSVIEAEVA